MVLVYRKAAFWFITILIFILKIIMKVEASRGVAAVEETKEKKHIFKMASNPINMKWYEWPTKYANIKE